MPTREGAVVLVLAIAIFLLATNLMSGLLFALDAVLVSLVLVGAATAYLPVHRVVVSRLVPARGIEGAAVPMEIAVTAARPGRFLTVSDGWTGARANAVLPQVFPAAPARLTLSVTPSVRGQFAVGPTEVASRGTLGLFVARRRVPARGRIIVWPQVQPVPPAVLAGLAAALEGSAAGGRTRQPDDLYGLRDYQRGDSLSRIHWRSSARRGALVVREYERPASAATVIVIDLDRRQSPARLDAVVRAAASLLRAAQDRGADAVLAGWNERYAEHRGWEEAMDWLAGAVASGPPLGEVLSRLAADGGQVHRRLFVVAASSSVPPVPAGATVILPADDVTSGAGLVYTSTGAVQAC